ncbi:hypothetical protein KIN34_14645 [Cellulomonas sp. DKR-3]|uniref:DUF2207 domain-containing protein n=1 Tax=Cellulomonas fulva TaxID=2835530 RepID=A0ABS5U297_9CELL|nr:hypothetical protein [Cellulomonas fulva]MBT0995522.1 hypothetical protein [Cellulomonas fulva]
MREAQRERSRPRARFLLGLAVAVWLLVAALALPGVAEPTPARSASPYDVPTGFAGPSGELDAGALIGIVAVVAVLALGVTMIVRNASAGRVVRVPQVVRDLEGRDYLTLEPVEGPHGRRDWLVRRRRLPDTRLNADERAWYFAIFGTGLVTSTLWSQVRPPSSATRRWADSAVPERSSPER